MIKVAVKVNPKRADYFSNFFKDKKKEIEKITAEKIKIEYFSDDLKTAAENKETDIILVLDDTDNSLNFIIEALKRSKIIICDSPNLLAENYKNLKKLADRYQSKIFFSSIFSPLPLDDLINNFYALDEIKEVNAVVNAATNYILGEMEKERISMKETIERAKISSYIEENPDLDLDGWNSLYKIILLANLIFDENFDAAQIEHKGIKGITSYDIIYSDELGFKIKLLATIKNHKNKLYFGVRPTLIKKNQFLASVNNNSNAVEIISKFNSKSILKSKNSDAASANLLSLDLIKAVKFINRRETGIKKSNKRSNSVSKKKKLAADLYSSQKNSYYIRLQLEKKEEVIEKIKNIFSEKNLADLILHDNQTETPLLPVIIISKKIKEDKLEGILKEVENLEGVLTVNNIIPIQKN